MGGTVAEVDVPISEFALGETFEQVPNAAFEIERIVANDPEQVIPFVWASGDGVGSDGLEEALAADSSVDEFERLAGFDDEWLYRMAWSDRVGMLVQILVEEGGTVLAAFGRDGTWNLRVLFPDHEGLSHTHEYCEEAGLTWDVKRIYRLDEGRQGRYGLTDKQQDTLAEAFERGYYEIPRKTAAKDLAGELGISHQALSEQLRRAHGNLVKNAIVVGRGAGENGSRSG